MTALTCDSIAGAKASLDGVELQWTKTIVPYGLNFMEYRRVSNLSVAVHGLDVSPYLTLPMVFDSADSLVFKVPKILLAEGAHYEFRMAYPFTSYTYRTNSIIVKTFDASSSFVSSVTWTSTHNEIKLSWKAPEHSAGLIGYKVRVLYQQEGNGDQLNPSWTASELTALGETQVDLATTSATIGCDAASAQLTECLATYTIYYVEVSVIREGGTDEPRHFYIYTTLLEKSSYDHIEVYIYNGDMFMTLVEPIGWMSNGTVEIGASPFAGARFQSPSGDLVVELEHSTVRSMSATQIKIVLSHEEYESMRAQIYRFNFTFMSLSLVYAGGNKSMPMLEFCKYGVRTYAM